MPSPHLKRASMLRANAGEREDGTQAEQEVLTPPEVIEMVERAFGGRIALDPCAPTKHAPSFFAERYVREAEDGLSVVWVDRTYVNPTFANLRPWLRRARDSAARIDCPKIVLLAPVRMRRRWFRVAALTATAVTFLDPVVFVGQKGAIPCDMCLITWNCIVEGPAIATFRKGLSCPEST